MRRLVLFAIVLMLPFASAQGGEPITITGPADASVSTDESASFTLVVTRGGTGTGSPLDQVGAGDVAITVGGAPEGWTVSVEPSGFPLDLGESQEVDITITVEPGASDNGATLSFTATLSSPDPSSLIAPSGEASHSVDVTRNDSSTRELLEFLGPGVWAVLGALIVAVIVAGFLLVDRGRRIVHLTAETGETMVAAGSTVTCALQLENVSSNLQRIALHAHSADSTWKVDLPVTELELDSGASDQFHVAIKAPKNAPSGSRAVVRVVAVPDESPRSTSVAAVTVMIE